MQLRKRMKPSSQRWLQRHMKDPFVHQAKKEGYRSRAVYKLEHIHEKYPHIFRQGPILELGCAPGSWSQWIEKKYPRMPLVGIDLIPMEPVQNMVFFQGDFLEETTLDMLHTQYPKGFGCILSDMAPDTMGHKSTDRLRMLELLRHVIEFAENNLKKDGHLVVKNRVGSEDAELWQSMRSLFQKISFFRPQATRKSSSEFFLVCQNRK